nr:UPF0587 protein C1orf123 homolog [Ipomoea batatas]
MLSSSTFVNTTSVINQGCCEENEMTCAAAAFCAFALYYDMIKLKCGCGEVTEKETCVSLNETVPLPTGGGMHTLYRR